GSELDADTKEKLAQGERIKEVLKQPQYSPLSVAEQVSILFAANEGYLDDVDNKRVLEFKKKWFEYFGANLEELSNKLNNREALSDEDKTLLRKHIEKFKNSFFG
ncbi:MAG: F0F1 ATP synthase subunit alpha, partial [Candidatus Gastranaerophilaceae bacterium]